tara:strand:+ start:1311 stop:1895 length:585 start_codon:yes stop_codon:yes gene_type:complete
MKKLDQSDLLTLEEYNYKREDLVEEVLEIKKNRRIPIGSNVSLLFENSATIKYQIQEMLTVKKVIEPDRIEEELSVYNTLVPDGSNLKATMIIEFPDQKVSLERLSQLIGIEDKVWLQIGENDRVFAIAEEVLDRTNKGKTSVVHFLRFELSKLMIKELKSGITLFAGIGHLNYNVRTQEVAQTISSSLSNDLD